MRAPFQILAIPYKMINGQFRYCVFHRADYDQWQFISGGGEDDETPMQAAKREIFEETGVNADSITPLTAMCYIPTYIFPKSCLCNWSEDTYVVPEYAFGFECAEDIKLSHEHTKCVWLSYEVAHAKLKWDSNKTALYELNKRLETMLRFNKMEELKSIMRKFVSSGWDLIAVPAKQWLDGKADKDTVVSAIKQADKECGSCGCELDPLYKRALELL